METKIPLCIAEIDEKEIDLVTEVLRSGWLAHGPKAIEFEEKFASFIGVKHAISVNSCTSALELAIQCLPNKGEVILPSFTWVASANSIVTSGCTPVFVDIDPITNNIDPEEIRKAITSKTVALMPVHFSGLACSMREICAIAEEHDLAIIEDSAETLGGTYESAKTGSFGMGCFSFYPTKNITCGEGGMLTTNDDAVADKAKALKGHGVSSSTFEREKIEKPWFRSAVHAGYNYRLCDILAAIGVAQMDKLDAMNDARRSHSKYLNKNLTFNEIQTPFEPENAKHVYQMYTLKVDSTVNRNKFVHGLRDAGIGASVHFDPPVHLQEFYKDMADFNLPVTEQVSESIVTLPMYPSLKSSDLDYMIEQCEVSLRRAKR